MSLADVSPSLSQGAGVQEHRLPGSQTNQVRPRELTKSKGREESGGRDLWLGAVKVRLLEAVVSVSIGMLCLSGLLPELRGKLERT